MKNLGVVTLQNGENVNIVTEKDLYDIIYNKLSPDIANYLNQTISELNSTINELSER